MKKQKGITIIALIITIILMLILATISVNVAINGGLFEKARDAVDSSEIANEKDTVLKANILAKSKNKIVTVKDVQKALDIITDENEATAMDNGDTIVVKFNKNDRYYEIENSGKVEGPKELPKEDYPGDLSKGNKYDGTTDETAFRITCIEDLVEFSKNYTKYRNSYIKLEKTLDFNSIFSYKDYTSKAFGDLNGDEDIDDIRTELTKQGDTCAGFTPISEFWGTFDGQNNKICNLYENVTNSDAGLFRTTKGSIKNLGLKNINITGTKFIGGIAGQSAGKIINCFVEGNSKIKGDNINGLIVGLQQWGGIENCYSIGKLEMEGTALRFGGIVAQAQNCNIKRCFNIMEIENDNSCGGIVDLYQNTTKDESGFTIEECYHIGNIVTGEVTSAGGIAAQTYRGMIIRNCYNIGSIKGKVGGGVVGSNSGDVFNCYSIGEIIHILYSGTILGRDNGGHIVHCFARRGDGRELPETLDEDIIISYLSGNNTRSEGHKDKAQIGVECDIFTDEEMKTESFVDELNILKTADDEGVITQTAQSVWKMDEEGINGGYPIFTWQTKGKTKY